MVVCKLLGDWGPALNSPRIAVLNRPDASGFGHELVC